MNDINESKVLRWEGKVNSFRNYLSFVTHYAHEADKLKKQLKELGYTTYLIGDDSVKNITPHNEDKNKKIPKFAQTDEKSKKNEQFVRERMGNSQSTKASGLY